MAAFFVYFLVFALQAAEAQQTYSNISLGSSLSPGTNTSWLSPSGLYAFGFFKQANGFAVGIFLAETPEKTVVWTANTDDKPTVPGNVTLLLISDGRLILQLPEGQEIYIANPSNSEPIASASMLDNGNFVLYNRNQKIIWQSFDHPTDTLLEGQRLSANQQLFSRASDNDYSRGIFHLIMHDDGNLGLYPIEETVGNAYFATNTYGDNVTLNLDDDGHLYLKNLTSIMKSLSEGGHPRQRTIYLARIDFDGILRVYSQSLSYKGNLSDIWSSTNDLCDPKGLCGLNGFCDQMDGKAECLCLPGFDFVNLEKWSSGCERNFTAESCKTESKDASSRYEMRRLDTVVYEDNSYSVLEDITIEDCEAACLEDCNCQATFYKNQQCRKQRLPLRYGRRLVGDSNIALIKVSIQESVTNEVPIDVPKEKKKVRVDLLAIGISLVVFAFLVLAISGILVCRADIWGYKTINGRSNIELIDDVALRAFSYAELVQATDDFRDELGKGAFGTVYKGILPAIQKAIAVKRLDKVLADGEVEFQTEMKVIGRTHHRNLVRLLGYCIDGTKRLLVYEFMSNGSLADILFTQENRLRLEERIKIALDIARGILYLHDECETQIIHCDIKPQNILMDENMCAKISDFGLAKLLKQDQTRTYTGIRGTKGYVALEWHRNLPVTAKVDVYSFGIVLLEIICRRRNVDWRLPENEAVLEEWVYEHFEAEELSKLVRDDEEVDKIKLERSVKVAIWCIQDEPSLRPSMKKVILMLEGTVETPVPPSLRSS